MQWTTTPGWKTVAIHPDQVAIARPIRDTFVEYLDTSVKTVEDVERYMSIAVLGIVPQKVKALNDPNARSGHAEAYRVMRTNVKSSAKFAGGKIVCLTSGSVGEGKTHTAFNFAYVCGEIIFTTQLLTLN